jgi:hypothetical protein
MLMNGRSPPFEDERVRQALNYAGAELTPRHQDCRLARNGALGAPLLLCASAQARESGSATARSAGEPDVFGEPASGVRDKFEQAAVGVAEVHARSLPARTVARHGAKLDLHAAGGQVVDRPFD